MINPRNYRFLLFTLIALVTLATLSSTFKRVEFSSAVSSLKSGLGYAPAENDNASIIEDEIDIDVGQFDSGSHPQTQHTETPQGHRYAFATFLSTRSANDSEPDTYFTATRVLAYQLLHQPTTKARNNIPFLVIVPPHVSEYKRRVLTEEGATIVPVEYLTPTEWEIEPGAPRWVDQYTKLRLFELTQYDRIAYMDNDMLVTRPLDDIFQEESVTTPAETDLDPEKTNLEFTDPAGLPKSYVLAGVVDNGSPVTRRPTPWTSTSMLNGGFFVLRPDFQLFSYYNRILQKRAPFDKGFMEMGLLNWAHRSDGEMPWTPLPLGKWCNNWPNWHDYLDGSATLHDKFWVQDNEGWIDRRLVELWWRVQGQMEGYWMMKSSKDDKNGDMMIKKKERRNQRG